MRACTRVPRPGGLQTWKRPCMALTRSARPRSPVPGGRVGAADAVVADLDLELVAVEPDRHHGVRRAAVLADVGERLGDHEVGRRLDRHRQPLVELGVELDGHRRAVGQRLQRGHEPAVGEHGGVDAGREVAQVVDRRLGVLERVVDEPAGALGVLLPALLGELEVDHDVDELLLGAVVEVAAEPAPLLVAGLQDAGARGRELLARVGVGERVGDQLGEAGDALLGVGGQAERAPVGGDHRAPQPAGDDDRRADRRADADRAQAAARARPRGRRSRRRAPGGRCAARAARPSRRPSGGPRRPGTRARRCAAQDAEDRRRGRSSS